MYLDQVLNRAEVVSFHLFPGKQILEKITHILFRIYRRKKGLGTHFEEFFFGFDKKNSKKNWVMKGGNDRTREQRNEGTAERVFNKIDFFPSKSKKNPAYVNSPTQNRGGGLRHIDSGRCSTFTPVCLCGGYSRGKAMEGGNNMV